MKDDCVAVFDIGGTYFRSAIWQEGRIGAVTRRSAINYLNTTHDDPLELQEALANYLAVETDRLRTETKTSIGRAGISLGAPVHAQSGLVLQSGPLWGPKARPFDLKSALMRRCADVRWTIANDVTAGLVRYLKTCDPEQHARILFVTVSTGIGSRLYDFVRAGIPVDPIHGIQGEIGHLPVEAYFRGKRLCFNCDCGGARHLNAYASGRGILRLLRELSIRAPDALAASVMASVRDENDEAVLSAFSRGVLSGDDLAMEVLDALTRPLATIFCTLLTHDPLVDSIVLSGGVVSALEPAYSASVDRQFRSHGLSQITTHDASYLARRLRIAPSDDLSGLIGAGHLADLANIDRDIHVFR